MRDTETASSKIGLTIRPYRKDHADVTIEIFLRSIRQMASKDYTPAQVDAWATVEDRHLWAQRRSSRPTWIVQSDGIPVGFADLEPDGHLDMMFVHPDHQGVGAAGLLLAAVEAEPHRQGIERIFTEASLTARLFFERKGFAFLARQSVDKRGQVLTNFRMAKWLR